MLKKFDYIKKLVLKFPQESQLEQHELQLLLFERRISKRSNKMFVLVARSVSVADAIIPINITSKISLEKFIFPSLLKKYINCQKTPKICFGVFSFAFYNFVDNIIYD